MRTVEETAFELQNQTAYALLADRRFSYYLYYPAGRTSCDHLFVLVHGTERSAEWYRNSFRCFADAHNAAVLAPLFPAGMPGKDDIENYAYLRHGGIPYDTILLRMIEEAKQHIPVNSKTFLLHGFSAGGQFVHRFFYLYPEWLKAVSIGAPGRITLPDNSLPWIEGTEDSEERFGRKVDLQKLAQVPVQVIVGEDDTELLLDGDRTKTRLEDNRRLAAALREKGVGVQLDLVKGAGHDGRNLLPDVMAFFEKVLM